MSKVADHRWRQVYGQRRVVLLLLALVLGGFWTPIVHLLLDTAGVAVSPIFLSAFAIGATGIALVIFALCVAAHEE